MRKISLHLRTIAACGAALSLSLTAAPALAVDVDTQQWSLFTFQKDLSRRWIAYFELQPRFGNDVSGVERLIVRPALGYRITPKFSVWQGYGWTPLFMPGFRDEHRLYQQFLYEETLGVTAVSNRTRFEQRFIEGTGSTSHRFRTMFRVQHPVSRDRRWAVVAYDELFWNLNSVPNGPAAGFDQNRVFLGVSRVLNPQLRVETGYLLNQINAPSGSPNRQLNVWVTMFSWRL